MRNKIYQNFDDAVADIPDGATIMFSGFAGPGTPRNLIAALHRAGLAEGLATCGTALTREHGRQLRRRTQVAILLFDGDSAGQKAMERALEVLLPEGLRVRAATLPRGQDPDDRDDQQCLGGGFRILIAQTTIGWPFDSSSTSINIDRS